MLGARWAAEWRHDYANLALGGGNLLILLPGLQRHSRIGWQISFALVGLTSPISGLPYLGYRYRIERKNGDRWDHVESGMSHDTLGI